MNTENKMIITSIQTEEYGVDVSAEIYNPKLSNLENQVSDNEETFTVQLFDNRYRSGLGCRITPLNSGGDINEDDYPDFDMSVIIEAAEQHLSKMNKSRAVDNAAMRARRIAEGLVHYRVWITPGEKQKLKEYLVKLRDKVS